MKKASFHQNKGFKTLLAGGAELAESSFLSRCTKYYLGVEYHVLLAKRRLVRFGNQLIFVYAATDGWAMSKNIDFALITRALRVASALQTSDTGLIFHSDRGSQHASKVFQSEFERRAFRLNISRRADCWDKATGENFLRGSSKNAGKKDFFYS